MSIPAIRDNLLKRRIEPRVGQVDASILDSELLSMLKDQLWQSFKYFRPDIKDKYESELLLLLKAALFKLTVWDHSTTYGAKLQSLQFVDARTSVTNKPITYAQKVGYGILVVGGSYIWQKLDDYLTSASYSAEDYSSQRRIDRLRRFTDSLSTLWSVSSLANFVLFLYSGRYSTLILRLLGIRLASTTRKVSRQVNFEFQNRQLVWNAFTEFLLFILPLLNLAKIKRTLLKYIVRDNSSGEGSSKTGELEFLPERTCAICYKEDEGTVTKKEITNPYKSTSCGHTYCYVCIESKLLENEGEGWNCLRCNQLIRSVEPFIDVDPNAIVVEDVAGDDEDNEEEPTKPAVVNSAEKNVPVPPPVPEPESETDEEEETDSDEEDEDEGEGGGSGFIVEDSF